MKIQTGNPVRGEDFFKRDDLVEKAWELITSGSHILIAAPRRVGKTSLMYYLQDNPRDNYHLVYDITESVNSENEFYRKVLNKLLKTDFITGSQKVKTFIEKHLPTVSKIGPDGVEFGVRDEHNYFEILSNVLKSVSSDSGKLVIMIDEFPETLENIINDEGEPAGRHFLQSNRELRQDSDICQNVQFIYTGSIGLENVVGRLNAVNTINDLTRLKVPPLRPDESKQLIAILSKTVEFHLADDQVSHVLNKIDWLIPFHIQLVMLELRNIWRDENPKQMTTGVIDKAFELMLERRNCFEHWHTRLRSSFNTRDYNFTKELLNIVSENGQISSNEMYDLAVKHSQMDRYKDLVGSLVYDGYINNNDDPKLYRFNSPIVQMWWRKNVAN